MPRLLTEVPGQPSPEALAANRSLHRFTLVFDREGYSPEFFLAMRGERIACQTYHKYPKDAWPTAEGAEYLVPLANGESVRMTLAERGTWLGDKLWVREIRKFTATGHQVSILSTDFQTDLVQIAAHMFARWSQENFFQYMMQHFAIDRLVDYQTCSLAETARVVNPAYRTLEYTIKRLAAKRSRTMARFGAIALPDAVEASQVVAYEQEKGRLKEEVDFLDADLATQKAQRKQTEKHVRVVDLPESDRFVALSPTRKQFLDTIKMIAYRAETAMAGILRTADARTDETRALLREILSTDADLAPDEEAGTLTVRLHHLANRTSDEAARYLADQLNATETEYPGTNLRVIYKLVSD